MKSWPSTSAHWTALSLNLVKPSYTRARIVWRDGKPVWFRPPVKVKFSLENALFLITSDYNGPFLGDVRWAFSGKENTVTS